MKARGSLVLPVLAAAFLVCAAPGGAAPQDLALGVHASPTFSFPHERKATLESALLVEINRTRVHADLARLRLSRALSHAAAFHSRDMAARGYFGHTSPDGRPFSSRVRRFYGKQGRPLWAVGENLAWARYVQPAEVVAAWLLSPSHRATLLSPLWREVGLGIIAAPAAPGVYGGTSVTILTADFGTRRRR